MVMRLIKLILKIMTINIGEFKQASTVDVLTICMFVKTTDRNNNFKQQTAYLMKILLLTNTFLNDKWTFVKLHPQKNDLWVPDGDGIPNLLMTDFSPVIRSLRVRSPSGAKKSFSWGWSLTNVHLSFKISPSSHISKKYISKIFL